VASWVGEPLGWKDLLDVFPDGPSSVVLHIIVSELGMLYSTFALYIAEMDDDDEALGGWVDKSLSNDA